MPRRSVLIYLVLLLAYKAAEGQSQHNSGKVEVVATASEYVPTSTTLMHSGHAYTNCQGRTSYFASFHSYGDFGSISGTADTTTNCATAFTPPRETTLTSYRRVNYTIAKDDHALYLLSCTQTWKPSRAGRGLAALIGGLGGGSGEDHAQTEERQAQVLTARGAWSECPAFEVGMEYAVLINSTSDVRIENITEDGAQTPKKPVRLEYLASARWSAFRAAVDDSDEAASAMLNGKDGKDATAIGLVGLDCVHECGSELHPLFAIAIHVSSSDQEDVWAMFVRNWGNEGWCSEFRHLFQQQDFIFRLPWRPGAVGVTVLNQNGDGTFLTNSSQVTGPNVTWAEDHGVDVAFHLPSPSEGARLNGELHLRWIMRSQPNRAARLQSSIQNLRGGSPSTMQGRKIATMTRTGGDEPLRDLVERMPPTQKQAFRCDATRPA